MTIASTTARNTYTLNGATTVYPYTYRTLNAADLRVVTRSASTGVETVLVRDVDYVVSGAGNSSGGAITLTSPGTSGDTLLIRRNRAITQPSALANQGRGTPAAIEAALDAGIVIAQQLQDQLDHTLRIDETLAVAGYDLTLPPALPNQVLGWNGTGTGVTSYPASTFGATASAMLSGFLNVQASPFSAVGSGAVNDRAAFASADSAAGAVATAYAPSGTYRIDSNLTLSAAWWLLPGAILKPASGVTVTIVGTFKGPGLVQCIDTSLGGRVVFSKGSVMEIFPHWWGSIASAAATFSAMYAALNVGGNVNGWNPVVRCPSGDYIFTVAPTIPNSLSYVKHVGDGKRSTRFLAQLAVAGPVMKWTNARSVRFHSVGIIYSSGSVPTYGLQFDVQTAGKVATPLGCGGSDLFIGGDSANCMQVGVGFTTLDGSDQNNEQSVWIDCDFYNLASAGIRAEHSNSNWHTLIHCQFSDNQACISSYKAGVAGGNFNAIACRFGNTTSTTSCVLEMGGQRYMTTLTDCTTEAPGYSYLVYTPAAITLGYGGAKITGGNHSLRDTTAIKWESSTDPTSLRARFILRDALLVAPLSLGFDFPGSDPVFIEEIGGNFGTLKYNGPTVLRQVNTSKSFGGGGDPTPTSYGGANARLHFENAGRATSMKALDTTTATPSVLGFMHRSTVSVGGSQTYTNFTGGYHGMELTLFFTSGTAVIANGNFYLNGTVNVTPPVNSTLTFRCTDIGAGLLRWIETSRMIR